MRNPWRSAYDCVQTYFNLTLNDFLQRLTDAIKSSVNHVQLPIMPNIKIRCLCNKTGTENTHQMKKQHKIKRSSAWRHSHIISYASKLRHSCASALKHHSVGLRYKLQTYSTGISIHLKVRRPTVCYRNKRDVCRSLAGNSEIGRSSPQCISTLVPPNLDPNTNLKLLQCISHAGQ